MVIKMKHQGKCYMNVSANSPTLCVSFSLSGDFSFSHSFLKYLQGKTRCWHFDFSSSCSWEETLRVISQLFQVMARSNRPCGAISCSHTYSSSKKKPSAYSRLWQNAFHKFQVLCVPLGGFGLFFLLNLLCPIWHWIVFPVCYWLKPPGLWWWFIKNHPIKKLSV